MRGKDYDKRYLICTAENNQIQLFDSKGQSQWVYNPASWSESNQDADGVLENVYNWIQRRAYNPNDDPVGILENIHKRISKRIFKDKYRIFSDPKGINATEGGTLYVADTGNNRIQKFDSDGNFLREWGSHGSEPGQFDEPEGVAVDDTLLKQDVYVADTRNHRVQVFTENGKFLFSWGSVDSFKHSIFDGPRGIFVMRVWDKKDYHENEDVYVLDKDRIEVYRIID